MDQQALRAAVVEALADIDAMHRRFSTLLAAIDERDGVQVPGQGHWTKAMTAELWVAARHLAGARALFEVTAAHPNVAVTMEQVQAASGLDGKQQRNHHARLSRISKQLFTEPRWPIHNWQSAPRADGKAETHYRMGTTVADWWHQIIADTEPAD